MLHVSLALMALCLADPTPEQVKLLTVFRDEFVAVAPAGQLPAYQIARYEVPQNLWEAVMGSNPSRWKGPRNSVEMLALEEARGFCRRATELLRAAKLIENHEVVRLPTEAEWEHAARAGTTTKYSFGDNASLLGDYAWFQGNAKGNDPPVGAKKPNPWGLYDVHGYLWEWVEQDTSRSVIDPQRGVVRGGSWKDDAAALVTGSRRVVEATLRDDAVGLRCVLAADPAAAKGAARPAPAQGQSRAAAGGDALHVRFQAQADAQAIVPAGAKLERLWADGEFTEGPALAPDGAILFSDIGESIYRFDPRTGQTALFRRPSGRANGLAFNQRGELIACEGANQGGNRRLSITTGIDGAKDGTVRTLAERYEGKRFNSPNDLAIDVQGNVYLTDPRYVGGEGRELDFEGVFLVSPAGEVKLATREVQKPNGILVSPDGKSVYLADNNPQGNRHLAAFAVQAGGMLTDKRVLYDFGGGRGIDGMALDSAGNIYAAAGTGDKAGVYVFDPRGKLLAMIPTPGDPTNCEFGGGSDSSSLYITCANSKEPGTKYGLYRIKLKTTGHHVVQLKP